MTKRVSGKGIGSRAKQEGEQLASFFEQSMGTKPDQDTGTGTTESSVADADTDQGKKSDTEQDSEPALAIDGGTTTGTLTGTSTEPDAGTVISTPIEPEAETSKDTEQNISTETDTLSELFPVKEKPELERKVFYLTKEQANVIEAQAKRTGLSQSEILRHILDQFLKK